MKKNKNSKKKTVKKAVLTNTKYAETDLGFNNAVVATNHAGHIVLPTSRQASKYRNKKGIVYLYTNGLVRGVR